MQIFLRNQSEALHFLIFICCLGDSPYFHSFSLQRALNLSFELSSLWSSTLELPAQCGHGESARQLLPSGSEIENSISISLKGTSQELRSDLGLELK